MFCRFDRRVKGDCSFFEERECFISMKLNDVVRYLHLQQEIESSSFSFCDGRGKMHQVANIADVALYMIDCDMPKYLPMLNEDYRGRFKVKEILPGGSFCMMNSMTR